LFLLANQPIKRRFTNPKCGISKAHVPFWPKNGGFALK
jgi:hypothetical protein